MVQATKQTYSQDSFAIHQLYIDIINAMPNIVYWVDNDCNLKGCNQQFIEFLGLKKVKDLNGTPYEQMSKLTKWPKERIEAFRLDDMKVIFSGVPQYDVEEAPIESKQGKPQHFLARRVPLLDAHKRVIGLVVILTDITQQKMQEKSAQKKASTKAVINPYKPVAEPHILMVEDDFIAQKVEEALLTELHCHVDIAESGDKALKLFGPGKYDVVFMDIGLEDTSGYLVAKKLRQMEENTNFHVPIIALTSYQAEIVKYDCKDYFMDGVLTKPLTSEQAKQIIQHFVNHEDVPVTGMKSAE